MYYLFTKTVDLPFFVVEERGSDVGTTQVKTNVKLDHRPTDGLMIVSIFGEHY